MSTNDTSVPDKIGNTVNANDSGPTNRSKNVSEFMFVIFQYMFAVLTPAIIIGGVAERVRLIPILIFIFIWSTLVYDVIASWCWSAHGWYVTLGGLDFVGGTPVHILSGAAAFAYCLIVDNCDIPSPRDVRSHNVVNVILGTALLWFGWFGFNAGSTIATNKRAIMASIVTNLSASISGLTWMFMDYRFERKLYAVSFCSGIIAGLVVITPGAGYVDSYTAVAYGIVGSMACNLASKVKLRLNYDDTMDVFAVHSVSEFIGNILTGIFADKILNVILFRHNFNHSLHYENNYQKFDFDLWLTKEAEIEGTDKAKYGESAYCFDDIP
ncbi:28027_t:CDS:2 [Gigaspora margarita]|uniref:28027_t:CDS:1 n=1 Tax=Gigaspora margarita TaxID=4874 RepID=A0ABN7VI01_GIGMA|nr:28027_t:CDS:2 [Gigaspora margarita]